MRDRYRECPRCGGAVRQESESVIGCTARACGWWSEPIPLQEQPRPVGGYSDCWLDVFRLVGPGHWLHPAMADRRQLGIDRYGQPLRHGDGRDALRDLREELLDTIVYAYRVHGEWGALQALRLAEALWRRGGDGAAEEEAPASVGGGDPQPPGTAQPEAATQSGPSLPWAPDESY